MSELHDKDRPDKELPDQQQLDEYLRGGTEVSRQYRQLRSADVPAEIDRLVLRQAQEAVKARPAKSRTWIRWAGPLALAASAVLVVSIVIESGVHEDTYLAAPASAPAEVAVQQDMVGQTSASGAVEEKASGAPQAEDKTIADDASVVHVVPVQPPEPQAYFEAPPAAAIAPEEPTVSRERKFAMQPVAPSPAPQFNSPQGAVNVEEAREQVEVTAQRARPAPVQESVSVPVQVRELDALEDTLVTAQKRRSEPQRNAGPRNTIVAPTSNAAEQEDEARDYTDPEQWLRDIRRLRKANKHDEADREWRRFRYVYPNYEIAEDDTARGALR